MRAEILKAIEAAKVIEEQKAKLVVGVGISRVPKDSEGNIFGSPIMTHFDAGKNLVFFRISDEEGDPWGFEVALPVAEALGLALNDLLGLFDAVESEKVASLEADLATTAAAANYFAEEKRVAEENIEKITNRLHSATKRIEELENTFVPAKTLEQQIEICQKQLERIHELEHFAASVSGLYATDRPDLVDQSLLNDVVLFKIEPPEAKK